MFYDKVPAKKNFHVRKGTFERLIIVVVLLVLLAFFWFDDRESHPFIIKLLEIFIIPSIIALLYHLIQETEYTPKYTTQQTEYVDLEEAFKSGAITEEQMKLLKFRTLYCKDFMESKSGYCRDLVEIHERYSGGEIDYIERYYLKKQILRNYIKATPLE